MGPVVVGISANFLAGLPSRLRGLRVVQVPAQSRHLVRAAIIAILGGFSTHKRGKKF